MTIEVRAPDGSIVQFPDGTDDATIKSVMRKNYGGPATQARPNAALSLAHQGTSGFNEGLADLAGFPVDAATSALNAGGAGFNAVARNLPDEEVQPQTIVPPVIMNLANRAYNAVAGSELPQIENPVGGSGMFRDMMAPAISDVQPQNMAERYVRRGGRELGAMAIPGAAVMGKAARPAQLAALEAASALGAGVAGQTAEELGAGPVVQDAAALVAGLTPAGVSRAVRPSPRAPTMDELRADRDAAYLRVDQSGAQLTPTARDDLVRTLEDRILQANLHPRLHTRAAATLDATKQMPQSPTISRVDQERQLWGDVAGAPEKGERRLGKKAKNEFDVFLDGLTPAQVTGASDPAAVVGDLRTGRERANRVHKAEVLEAEDVGLLDKARRRAGTAGTGGNTINAIRQNVSRILGNPKLRAKYNDEELDLMRKIADGTETENFLRWVGRSLSPTTGALGGVLGLGQVGAGVATGNPLWLAPGAVGLAAKGTGEALINSRVEQLAELIRNGAPVDVKKLSDTELRAIVASLAAQAAKVGDPARQ